MTPTRVLITGATGFVSTGTNIVQRSDFQPRGFLGLVYWYAVAPFHRWPFPRMLSGAIAVAEQAAKPLPDERAR